ncbi:MAG TPA: MbcA/ParS/Xre antitoxin family protein [Limnobacter sp.]|uniref:MbcA/ParS/Xre antitoxin family protein n=1 Tax=Limnobacter sp. TaxID=2003368 RepID=UPI002ED7F307
MLTDTIESKAEIDRSKAAVMIMKLFDLWGLQTEESTALLGLAKDNRTALAKYRKGDPISNSRDSLERLSHLFAIHKNLRLLYPQKEVCYAWMKKRNLVFDGLTPVEVIDRFGFRGLLMVRSYLDRARGH